MRLKKDETGMSIIDVVIGVALLAFFVTFLPQVIVQSRRLYQQATLKAELTRIRQIMLIGSRNVERIRTDLEYTITNGGAGPINEFKNCFGQRGPSDSRTSPIPKGVGCNTKFRPEWADIKEVPPPAGVLIFNKQWTLNGECAAGETCMMNTSAQYYVVCEPGSCSSIHVLVRMTPTLALLALRNTAAGANLSADDFVEKKTEIVFPGTIFGSNNDLTTQVCTGTDTFIELLNTTYKQFYCNTAQSNHMDCSTSVAGLNASCAVTTLAGDSRVIAGTFSPVSSVNTVNTVGMPPSDHLNIMLCATPGGYYGTQVDPTDPSKLIPKLYPDFTLGDQVVITCGGIFSNMIFTKAADSEKPVPNFCKTQSVLVGDLNTKLSVDCVFEVLTAGGTLKGPAAMVNLKIISSAPPPIGPGATTTSLIPGSTTTSTLGGGAVGGHEIESGEI